MTMDTGDMILLAAATAAACTVAGAAAVLWLSQKLVKRAQEIARTTAFAQFREWVCDTMDQVTIGISEEAGDARALRGVCFEVGRLMRHNAPLDLPPDRGAQGLIDRVRARNAADGMTVVVGSDEDVRLALAIAALVGSNQPVCASLAAQLGALPPGEGAVPGVAEIMRVCRDIGRTALGRYIKKELSCTE